MLLTMNSRPLFYLRILLLSAALVIPATGEQVLAQEGTPNPVVAFRNFWSGFMAGDPEQVRPFLMAQKAAGLNAEALQYRIYYPPIVEVTDSEAGAENIMKLTLAGTYVHPYDPETMGPLSAYEKRYGKLAIVQESYEELLQRVPPDFAARLKKFVESNGTAEIWLLDIPGRALVIKEDGVWKVDVYHFDDKTMRRTAPRRLILPENPDTSVPESSS